ncbi:transcriptional regulator [Actinotalea solisilvae]|uniref:transcriptional regulator n=1 Tax=Actinotalea solisilvae TaxID=2072922 RepID=UPI0018F15648|nr:transcriptional regulator [Actinotalea solisilvae]
MSHVSADDVRVLHAVRTLGYASTARVAGRAGLRDDDVREHLLDAQARGWVSASSWAGDSGWSLTEAGRVRGEALLAAELDAVGARGAVEDVHRDFLPLNEVVAEACTSWQLTELGIGGGGTSLPATVARLEAAAVDLARLEERLTARLARFAGYHARFARAVERAHAEPAWINGTDRDSCHRVWFELHEDLIATLGLTR